jgi:hypothetical protein
MRGRKEGEGERSKGSGGDEQKITEGRRGGGKEGKGEGELGSFIQPLLWGGRGGEGLSTTGEKR